MQSTYKGTHSMSQQQQHTENKHGFMVSCMRLRTWRTLCVIRHIALFLVSPLLVCYKMSEKFTLISLWIKPTDSLNSSFIGITTLHVSDSLSAYHKEFLAVHQLWYTLCSCDRLLPGVDGTAVSAPDNKRSQLHKIYQSRYTAKNSWW